MNKTIVCDIDGIVADTLPYWLSKIGERTGVYAKLYEIDRWDLSSCSPLDSAEPKAIFGLLNEPGFCLNIPLMQGADKYLRFLYQDGYKIHFATARAGSTEKQETVEWLKKYFYDFARTNTRFMVIFLLTINLNR
jgi:5'(3')-deoxyribonucleotidase